LNWRRLGTPKEWALDIVGGIGVIYAVVLGVFLLSVFAK